MGLLSLFEYFIVANTCAVKPCKSTLILMLSKGTLEPFSFCTRPNLPAILELFADKSKAPVQIVLNFLV